MAQHSFFHGDVPTLLGLVFNPHNSNVETVLKELVLNASDALNQIFYESLSDPVQIALSSELFIRIAADIQNKTLT